MLSVGAIFGNLVEIAVFASIWAVVHEIIYRSLKVPDSIKAIEDRKARNIKYAFYASYYPALIHAPTVVILSIICILLYGISYGQPSKPLENFTMKFSMSYFLHDLVFGIYRKYNDGLIHAHHILCGIVLGWALFAGKYGNEACQGIALGEVTNPIYAVYDLMNMLGHSETKTRPLGIAFMVTFILIRTTLVPLSMVHVQASHADLFYKVVYSGMWVISMMLIWMMLNKIAKLLSQVPFPP